MRFGHPSLRRLQGWANGEPARPSLERHLATCSTCADRLERTLDGTENDIRGALLTLLTIPDQLPERLTARIDQRLAARSDLALITEFFGLPLRTARIISTTQLGDD